MPKVYAMSAVAPVPTIKPNVPSIIKKGITRFTAANATLPAKLETKIPSTTPYTELKTIMIIDGMANRISLPYVKCSES